MSALSIAGLVVIVLGVVLIVVGTWHTLRAQPEQEEDKSLAEVIEGLAKFADALAKHPVGLRLVFVGVLLIILGGTISGISTLAC